MRRFLPVLGVGIVVLVSAASAWACVSGPTTFVTPNTVQPGNEVKVTGVYFTKEQPVEVRFNALDGPVLGTFTPAKGSRTYGLEVEGTVVVPASTKPGSYVLVVTQRDEAGKLVQTPSRLLLTVTGPGGATPALGAPLGVDQTQRPPSLVVSDDDAMSVGAMVLIGLGAAGVGLLVAGVAASVAGRRGSKPETVPVSR